MVFKLLFLNEQETRVSQKKFCVSLLLAWSVVDFAYLSLSVVHCSIISSRLNNYCYYFLALFVVELIAGNSAAFTVPSLFSLFFFFVCFGAASVYALWIVFLVLFFTASR